MVLLLNMVGILDLLFLCCINLDKLFFFCVFLFLVCKLRIIIVFILGVMRELNEKFFMKFLGLEYGL